MITSMIIVTSSSILSTSAVNEISSTGNNVHVCICISGPGFHLEGEAFIPSCSSLVALGIYLPICSRR